MCAGDRETGSGSRLFFFCFVLERMGEWVSGWNTVLYIVGWLTVLDSGGGMGREGKGREDLL